MNKEANGLLWMLVALLIRCDIVLCDLFGLSQVQSALVQAAAFALGLVGMVVFGAVCLWWDKHRRTGATVAKDGTTEAKVKKANQHDPAMVDGSAEGRQAPF